MTPLHEAPVDARARVAVLAFDVDDTVTRDGMLEVAALDAMYRARGAGITLVAATGRPIGWAEVFAATWPIDAAIGENGAGVCVPGRETELALETAAAIASQARARACVRARHPQVRESRDGALRRVDVAFDVGEHARIDEAEIAALRATLAAEGFGTTRSSVHVHALPATYDKATGIVRALALLGRDAASSEGALAFVGDSPNDEAAFARFAFSVGVANVTGHVDALRVRPRYITRAARGEGFAELVHALIDAREEGRP